MKLESRHQSPRLFHGMLARYVLMITVKTDAPLGVFWLFNKIVICSLQK